MIPHYFSQLLANGIIDENNIEKTDDALYALINLFQTSFQKERFTPLLQMAATN